MSYSFEGINELQLTMQEVAELPDATKDAMLSAGADVFIRACKNKITELGMVRTGQLLNSIKAIPKRKKDRDNELYYLVYPAGTRKKQGRSGKKATNNAEVGFIHEYGLPRKHIPAKQWMRSAVDESADAVVAAEAAVYSQYLKSKGL